MFLFALLSASLLHGEKGNLIFCGNFLSERAAALYSTISAARCLFCSYLEGKAGVCILSGNLGGILMASIDRYEAVQAGHCRTPSPLSLSGWRSSERGWDAITLLQTQEAQDKQSLNYLCIRSTDRWA